MSFIPSPSSLPGGRLRVCNICNTCNGCNTCNSCVCYDCLLDDLAVVVLYMPSYKTVFPIPGSLIPVFSRQKDWVSLQIEKHVVYKFVQIALDSVQNMCYTCAWP